MELVILNFDFCMMYYFSHLLHAGVYTVDFDPEDGGDIFHRNVGLRTDYTVHYPRR
jgi:hypothetical protein